MGKDFCPNFLQPFLENIDRRSCNDGSLELIPVFHNPHRKCRFSPWAVARTLEYLVGVPSLAASSGWEEKQVRINIQKALEYLEGGNEVIPKTSPLQGMKAQSLHSLFVGEVTHASKWIHSILRTNKRERIRLVFTRSKPTSNLFSS